MIKSAWRNIWRNKRRTLITASSVFFAVFFALMMRSVQVGSLYKMVNDIVSAYTGAVQIHQKGYWNDKSVNNSFIQSDKLENEIKSIHNVKLIVPRFESFALASSGNKTKGVLVVGVNPKKEDAFTHLSEKVKKGKYFAKSDEVLLGDELAKYLNLSLGDTVVLLSQGYHGQTAAGKYPIAGILHFASPKLNRSMMYMPLVQAQKFYACENRLTALAIELNDNVLAKKTNRKIQKIIDTEKYETMSWKEILPELSQLIITKNASSSIIIFMLYMIVGFGVLGTIVMMTGERMREFGVLTALGMRKGRLISMVVLETLFLGLIGLFIGGLASLPIIHYYNIHPILMTGPGAVQALKAGFEPVIVFAMKSAIFFKQLIFVLIIILLSLIYPLTKIAKLNAVEAMRK